MLNHILTTYLFENCWNGTIGEVLSSFLRKKYQFLFQNKFDFLISKKIKSKMKDPSVNERGINKRKKVQMIKNYLASSRRDKLRQH